MISLDGRSSSNVEVVQPESPPSSRRSSESPEIRVTDSPPTLATPHPLLFQPFLPLMRPLPFSIDNILKPTFGRNVKSPVDLSAKSSSPPPPPTPPLSKQQQQQQSSPQQSTPDKNDDEKKDDCPPGMVRGPNGQLWPAWVFCTRYSDRPSSGPRARKTKKREKSGPTSPTAASTAVPISNDEKRPRTAFSSEQLNRLRREFEDNRYLNEERRRSLATELNLNETQIKIWFQNKRAKLKKSTGGKGDLAKMLEAQGLYNHSTVSLDDDGEEMIQV